MSTIEEIEAGLRIVAARAEIVRAAPGERRGGVDAKQGALIRATEAEALVLELDRLRAMVDRGAP